MPHALPRAGSDCVKQSQRQGRVGREAEGLRNKANQRKCQVRTGRPARIRGAGLLNEANSPGVVCETKPIRGWMDHNSWRKRELCRRAKQSQTAALVGGSVKAEGLGDGAGHGKAAIARLRLTMPPIG